MSKTSLVMATDPKDTPQLPQVNKKDFWQIFLNGISSNENIYAVLSAKQGFEWAEGKPAKESGHTVLLSYNEVAAFFELEQELQQIKERLILVHGGIKDPRGGGIIIPEFRKDGTLIIIGSPNANKLCQRILSLGTLLGLPFRFGVNEKGKCIHVYQDEKGEWSEQPLVSFPSLADEPNSKDDVLGEDFGIILRITNPLDASDKNKALILGGNHGFGTESAVRYVADKERMKQLTDIVQDQDFEILFQAFVSGNYGLRLGIRKLAILKDGEWQQVDVP